MYIQKRAPKQKLILRKNQYFQTTPKKRTKSKIIQKLKIKGVDESLDDGDSEQEVLQQDIKVSDKELWTSGLGPCIAICAEGYKADNTVMRALWHIDSVQINKYKDSPSEIRKVLENKLIEDGGCDASKGFKAVAIRGADHHDGDWALVSEVVDDTVEPERKNAQLEWGIIVFVDADGNITYKHQADDD